MTTCAYIPNLAAKKRPAVMVMMARMGCAETGTGGANGVPADQAAYYE